MRRPTVKARRQILAEHERLAAQHVAALDTDLVDAQTRADARRQRLKDRSHAVSVSESATDMIVVISWRIVSAYAPVIRGRVGPGTGADRTLDTASVRSSAHAFAASSTPLNAHPTHPILADTAEPSHLMLLPG